MNWVPLFFTDAVCHQLKHETFTQVSQLSGSWSEFGAEHGEKRREFRFYGKVYGREISYIIEDRKKSIESPRMLAADLDWEFDRIRSVLCNSEKYFTNWVSMVENRRDVLSIISSLAANCTWRLFSERIEQNRIFLEAFENCPGFDKSYVQEQGRESQDFIARQVELGNVRSLDVYARLGKEIMNWPELEKLAKTLKTFVNSPRFNELIYDGSLANDIELFELFLKRARASELKTIANLQIYNISLDKIRTLHPECREDSTEIAWRIPNSNRRVASEECDRSFCLEVMSAASAN